MSQGRLRDVSGMSQGCPRRCRPCQGSSGAAAPAPWLGWTGVTWQLPGGERMESPELGFGLSRGEPACSRDRPGNSTREWPRCRAAPVPGGRQSPAPDPSLPASCNPAASAAGVTSLPFLSPLCPIPAGGVTPWGGSSSCSRSSLTAPVLQAGPFAFALSSLSRFLLSLQTERFPLLCPYLQGERREKLSPASGKISHVGLSFFRKLSNAIYQLITGLHLCPLIPPAVSHFWKGL